MYFFNTKIDIFSIVVAGCGNRAPVVANQLVSDEEFMFRMTITKHSTMIQERTITNLDDTTG